MQVHQGKKFRVVHCEGALTDLEYLLEDCPKSKRSSLKQFLYKQIERLGDGIRIASHSFPKEAELPRSKGGDNGNFYALKKIPVRGYCWRSKTQHNTWFISHYALKRKDKLSRSDTARVHRNWIRIEENNHEF
jgi:hypothetical protein